MAKTRESEDVALWGEAPTGSMKPDMLARCHKDAPLHSLTHTPKSQSHPLGFKGFTNLSPSLIQAGESQVNEIFP